MNYVDQYEEVSVDTNVLKSLKSQLLASQAREAQLREALGKVINHWQEERSAQGHHESETAQDARTILSKTTEPPLLEVVRVYEEALKWYAMGAQFNSSGYAEKVDCERIPQIASINIPDGNGGAKSMREIMKEVQEKSFALKPGRLARSALNRAKEILR